MSPRHLSYTHKGDPDKFKRLSLNKEEPFGRSHIDSIPKNEEKTSLPEPREQTPHKTLQTSSTTSFHTSTSKRRTNTPTENY
jgi:hypothetical protein